MATKDFDPSTLVLREATEEERIACWKANGTSWAKKLSLEDYLTFSQLNSRSALARDGGARYWVFTGPGNAEDGEKEQIYASLETLRKPIVIKTADGKVSTEWGHGVAGVWTMVPFRGKKIGTWLMRKTRDWLDSEDAKARVSALFSGIGDWYSPLGWPVFLSKQLVLPPAQSSPSVEPITLGTLKDICDRDVARLTADITNTPLPEGIHTRLAFLPSYEQACWHLEAEDFVASKLFPSPPRKPTVKGAIAGSTWGYWVRHFNGNILIFLRLVPGPVSTPEEEARTKLETAQVLMAAQHEAAEWGLEKVIVWNPDPVVEAACQHVNVPGENPTIQQRGASVPCLRWKGGEGENLVEKGIEWVAAERYCWC